MISGPLTVIHGTGDASGWLYSLSGGHFLSFLPSSTRALAVKEIKTFFRDQTQWSQLFLIAALVIIYIYNFKVLPLEKSPIKTVYLQNLLSSFPPLKKFI